MKQLHVDTDISLSFIPTLADLTVKLQQLLVLMGVTMGILVWRENPEQQGLYEHDVSLLQVTVLIKNWERGTGICPFIYLLFEVLLLAYNYSK